MSFIKGIAVATLLIFLISFLMSKILVHSGLAVVVIGISMHPNLKTGDLVILESPEKIKVGDIVIYRSDETEKFDYPFLSAESSLIIHRVQEMNSTHVITKGDFNPDPDKPITLNSIKRKASYSLPALGCFYLFNIGRSQSSCLMYPVVMKLHRGGGWSFNPITMIFILIIHFSLLPLFYKYKKRSEVKILYSSFLVWFLIGFTFSFLNTLKFGVSIATLFYSFFPLSLFIPLYWFIASLSIVMAIVIRKYIKENIFYLLIFIMTMIFFFI